MMATTVRELLRKLRTGVDKKPVEILMLRPCVQLLTKVSEVNLNKCVNDLQASIQRSDCGTFKLN